MITKQELLERLKARGIDIGGNPNRMLTKFISLGLISKPERFGLGQGKGIVSKFDESVIDDIEFIVLQRNDGLTYREIARASKDMDAFVKSAIDSGVRFKTGIHALSSDAEKGRFKLSKDVTEHLVGVTLNELRLFFYDYKNLQSVFNSLKFMFSHSLDRNIDDLLDRLDIKDEDYVQYLEGRKGWKLHLGGLSIGQLKLGLAQGNITQQEVEDLLKQKEAEATALKSLIVELEMEGEDHGSKD